MPTLETHNGYPLWEYIPNRPAAIVFAILFGCITIFHSYLMFRNRQWFCLPFVIGGLFEIIGYVGRVLAYDQTGELPPYILQSILLLLAPILFAASLYTTLSRVILAVEGDKCSLIRPRWLTGVFVTGDVISFLMQGGGAGILVKAGSKSLENTGENIIVGGLVFQILMFGVFCTTALAFHIRFRKHGPIESSLAIPWQSTLVMLYVTSACIMTRNIYRAIAYAMGQDGYLLSHEWSIYVFDGVLMLFTMLCFAYRYPGRLYRAKTTNLGMDLVDDNVRRRSST